MLAKLLVLLGFLALEAFLAALQLPLLRGQVPPNPTYGLRIAATLGDERVWYAANRASAREGLWTAGLSALLAVLLFLVWRDASLVTFTFALVALLLVGLLGGAAYGIWRARRLARSVAGPASDAPGRKPAS